MFGKFYENQNEGVWKCFWENGNLRLEISKSQEVIEGPLNIYYESGELMFSGHVIQGVDEFKLKKFLKCGREIKVTNWRVADVKEILEHQLN